MTRSSAGPLAVLLDPAAPDRSHAAGRDAWHTYAEEVLDHWRMPHEAMTADGLAVLDDRTGVVLVPAPVELGTGLSALLTWVGRGGQLVCVGAPAVALGRAVGIESGAAVAQGELCWSTPRSSDSADTASLPAFGGVGLRCGSDATVLAIWVSTDAGAPVDEVAAARVPIGAGSVTVLGADAWHSIVRIQQGWPIVAAGPAPADGTAPTGDGILRSCDGVALSYDRHRSLVPGRPAPPMPYRIERPPPHTPPIFTNAHADRWRELLLHLLLDAAEAAGSVLPWLHYWPAGVPAVTHVSHDSDRNLDDQGRLALDAFAAAGVRVTWCHCWPGGYAPETVAAIAHAGHEQALHYNAIGDVSGADWCFDAVAAQVKWVADLTGVHPVTNKNHYTTWRGWTECYEWLERLGVATDQSRGPSRQGNVGFPFGTSHLSFPITDHRQGNRRIDVLALPLHTQDLHSFVHDSVRTPILMEARRRHGLAHVLFHGSNMAHHQGTVGAVRDTVAAADGLGMPCWTSERIQRWERDRREVHVSVRAENGRRIVTAHSRTRLRGAAVLVPVPDHGHLDVRPVHASAAANQPARRVTRHSRAFVELTADLGGPTAEWEIVPAGTGSRSRSR